MVASDETLTIVVEPRHHLMGIAWPATAWHMTKDTCTREAVSIRYTASISCAQSLTYKSQGKTRTVHPFARQGSLPPAGGHEPEMSDADYPLDFLHRLPSTAKENVRYDDNAPPSEHLFENPLTVHISIQSVET